MVFRYFLLALVLARCGVNAQVLKQRPEKPGEAPPPAARAPAPAPSVSLNIPPGTPLKVTIDQEVRIRRVGQPVRGKTSEPIYAFDRLLLPAGTEVTGRIAAIDPVRWKMRTLSAMNADFSPERKVRVEFDHLRLPDGRRLEIHTVVSPGSGVLQFVPAKAAKPGKISQGKQAARGKLNQARQELKREIAAVKEQIFEPGRLHRLERFALAESPYRRQYLSAGTSFNADLEQTLPFGSEELRPETVSNIGTLPPSGGMVHAWLRTALDSATSQRGDPVEAVVSQPLVVAGELYVPAGSVLRGSVLEVRRAGRFARNGELRITFHQVAPPNGLERQIEATLEGLEVAQGENLSLDSEGGAQVRASKSRYLTTGVAVMLAATSSTPDEDHGGIHGGASGGAGGGALNGASGFRLAGTLLGVFAHSQPVTAGLGAYGAARSVYSHFLARGRDVVYPRDMAMVLALGKAEKHEPGDRTPADR